MDEKNLKTLLEKVKNSKCSIDEACEAIKTMPITDLGFAAIDNHRELRTGYPEVIYCEKKLPEHVEKIIDSMIKNGKNILATRVDDKTYNYLSTKYKNIEYNSLGKTLVIKNKEIEKSKSYICIVSAGTSDLYVVEEAMETAKILGNSVKKIVDVGVSGIHRLVDKLPIIRGAKVIIVVAGMDGALASVIGGMVDKPVIAVPTSVGYGANFNGIAPLLSMLNSCASGVTVVNIDNGFGAAFAASLINKL